MKLPWISIYLIEHKSTAQRDPQGHSMFIPYVAVYPEITCSNAVTAIPRTCSIYYMYIFFGKILSHGKWVNSIDYYCRCHYQWSCDMSVVNFWRRDGSSARITYTVTDCDANAHPQRELPIEVSRGGLLTTSAFSGQACLLVSSVEDFGVNQSTLVHVKVSVLC